MFLPKVLGLKREEVFAKKARISLEEMSEKIPHLPPPRDFKGAIQRSSPLGLIAEIKKASPSAGIIGEGFDTGEIAQRYQAGGACAISVLTERNFFRGDVGDLTLAKEKVSIPILQKDFVIDPFQIYEGRISGADALLLIAAILGEKEIREFAELAQHLSMAPLVEIHDEEDLRKVRSLERTIIGINNRNLKTLRVDLEATLRLMKKIPEGTLVISESGIKTREEVKCLQEAGVKGILVGETLMRAQDPASKIRELLND